MKESVTKFDLEAAFKALEEIEMPKADKVKANRPALTEIFSHKTKFDALMEEYYDISSVAELDDAKEAREAEVAQAKLARIEKIVDLDAESPEDLLPSYVGKFIMQCPQCMTLFYKNPEDIEASEEDPSIVNVAEVCQHCGNESGYTLVGKVGEATEEEQAEAVGEQEIDVDSTEDDSDIFADEPVETPAEDEAGELDELDLDELDLDIEDDEPTEEDEEKKEESFAAQGGEQILTEQLTEEAELDVSADEFEKLISSPEFKKPISDTEARAMMDEVEGETEEVKEGIVAKPYSPDFLSDAIHDVFNTGEFAEGETASQQIDSKKISYDTYKVTHPAKHGVSAVVKFDVTNKESSELKFTVNGKRFITKHVPKAQSIIINELNNIHTKQFDVDIDESVNVNNENLKYVVLNSDGTFAGVPCVTYEEARELWAAKEGRIIVELGKPVEPLTESVSDNMNSRASKADWVLENAKEGQDKKFSTFIAVGFNSTYSDGKEIETIPELDNKNLVAQQDATKLATKYQDVEDFAKDWSQEQDNGPVVIYLAKDNKDTSAAPMCMYFKGELHNDQLEKYFDAVTKETESDQPDVSASEQESAETNESLGTIMSNIDSLQESALEAQISESLVEAYGNVAGFRLTECAYEGNTFTVSGTIYFTSGNKRATSYVFSEAYSAEDGRVNLRGLNEKLGAEKRFTLTGYADNTKTFITESFKRTDK